MPEPVFEAASSADKATNYWQDTQSLLHHFQASENQLINLSAELLAILTTLSQQQQNQNLPELHQHLLKSMSKLHNRGLQADYTPRMMEKTCYALCAAFDEEIMNTWWGQEACWENHSLVARLFKQRNAGEVFFILLEQARQNTAKMIDFIELLYLLLRLGFRGRYQNSGGHALTELTNDLYDDIRKYRTESPVSNLQVQCSPWQPLQQPRPIRYLPVILVVLLLSGIASHLWIRHLNNIYSDNLDLLSAPLQKTSKPSANTTNKLSPSP